MTTITAIEAGKKHLPDAPQAWKPENGDILQGGEYAKQPFTQQMVLDTPFLIGLSYICENTWDALREVNVDPRLLKIVFEYRCPFIKGNTHWHFIPHNILAQTIEPYAPEGFVPGDPTTCPNMYLTCALDSAWMKQCCYGVYPEDGSAKAPGKVTRWPPEMNGVQQAMAGHGYTDYTRPCDGSGCFEPMCLQLSNGDLLAGWLWVWFNK